MRLKPNLPPTRFDFPRGYGASAIPNSGDVNRPLSAIWWTKEELLSNARLDFAPGSIFLGRIDGRMIGLRDNRHLMAFAGSRGGKTTCLLIPNLLIYPGSALVIDPKGELASMTAAARAERFGQDVRVLDPWGVADVPDELRSTYDPLAELRDDPRNLIDDADLLADALVIGNERDPHWTDAARALLRALILWLAVDPDWSGGSLAALPGILARIMEEAKGDVDGLLEELAAIDAAAYPEWDEDVFAIIRDQARMMIGANDRERASILSTARTQLAFLESPALRANLASSALRLPDLKRKTTTIYLCLPASRMGTHARWLRLFVNLSVSSLERTPSLPDSEAALFILEEFAALGHLRALEQAVAYMAGYGVKLWAVLQDLSQLKRHYKEGWETFLGNAGIVQAFSVADSTTAQYLSKRLGETTFQITNKVDVSARQALEGDLGLRREFKTAPLLSPDEIERKFARRSDGHGGSVGGLALVCVAGAHPFVVDRVHHGELEP